MLLARAVDTDSYLNPAEVKARITGFRDSILLMKAKIMTKRKMHYLQFAGSSMKATGKTPPLTY